MDKINKQRVLIAPLDWGLGHATRCIPIIQAFQNLGYEVILAADGAVANLLSKEFKQIRIIHLSGYHIQYAKSAKGLAWKLFLQIPQILKTIREEQLWLEKIVDQENIDLVISDNRYGLYSKKVPSVFITHQLTIKTPFDFLETLIQKINYQFINRFTACWVPDEKESINIAGILSHPKKMPAIPVHYLGIVSRMQLKQSPTNLFDFCFLLSGPEPQRTLLENKIILLLPKLSGSAVIIRGLPDSEQSLAVPENTKVFNHLPNTELASLISSSKLIICRSGYTSVMELIGMQKKALLIPTPGQTEQEYLAMKLTNEGRFSMTTQEAFNLIAVEKAANNNPIRFQEFSLFTTKTLEALLQEL